MRHCDSWDVPDRSKGKDNNGVYVRQVIRSR